MVLFRVSTHFQLLGAIIVKMQLLPNVDADLHLDDCTDFSLIVDNIKKLNIFRNVEMNEECKIVQGYKNLSGSKKTNAFTYPKNIWNVSLDGEYSDIYIGHDAFFNKMFYYYLVNNGQHPAIHILDEGMSTYFKDIIKVCVNDPIDHNRYKDLKYVDNICELLLYDPDLYMCKNVPWRVNAMPCISAQAMNAYVSLYEKYDTTKEIPKEPYIFFAVGFKFAETNKFAYTNELDILNFIAEEVGKENIVVKPHPINGSGSAKLHGYKIWDVSLPWEYYLFKYGLKDKIMISILSSACISSHQLLRQKNNIVFLNNLIMGDARCGLFGPGININRQFAERIKEVFNKSMKHVFLPVDIDEAKEQIRYINGKIKVMKEDIK